jgi:transposase
MRKKIYVTASDMLALREQGLSNHDIAKSLDVSIQTVRRYIGSQGGRMESLEAFRDTPLLKKEEKKESAVVETPMYEPIIERYKIRGFDVELDGEDRDVTIATEEDVIVIPYDSVPDLVQFLAWAMRKRMEVTADAQTEQIP